ncbi:hypothetical protein [Yoonia sp. SS1-5]|uniref:Right-handed parallel beta-helix repeat-containing protein n=1 Tax=Yoonia rhodophyticola TaxID=3137370 RepID=A0AAN0MF95_9RHOB
MTTKLKSTLLAGTTAAIALISSGALAQTDLLVTTTADSGEGSLRAALAAASEASDPARIVVLADGTLNIDTTLSYDGTAPLTVVGMGQTVKTDANATLFAVSQGASIAISDLTFEGPGGYHIQARGDVDGQTAGKGIFVDVRDDQTETVFITLTDVTVKGVANHGIHISDCLLADDCGGGQGGAGDGSPASIHIALTNVEVNDAGNGRFDADGFRVDERGAGDIHFTAYGSLFTGVGADGVELDEGQDGSVIATVVDTAFTNNGGYCDPALLSGNMPEDDEAEFEDGEATVADIPGPVTGSLDDRCFEREVDLYDSGNVEAYEFGIDLDDGIDFDEAGEGNIETVMINSVITGNLDEGVDFDEEDNGDIIVQFINTDASGNTDDGFKMSELDAGDVHGRMVGATAMNNGGKGAVFEEDQDGNLAVTAAYTKTANNDDGDDTGMELLQADDGTGSVSAVASKIADGFDLDGVEQ